MNFLDKINDSENIVLMLFIFTVILLLLYNYFKKTGKYDETLIEEFNIGKSFKKMGKGISKGVSKATPKVPDIGKLVKDIERVGSQASSLGKEVTKLGKTVSSGINKMEKATTKALNSIDDKLSKFKDDVIKTVNKLVIEKIKNLFTGLGNVLNEGIVVPLKVLFVGIGNIFLQIFEILKKIAYKIVSLPSCIIFYLLSGINSSILGTLSAITPSWIENPVSSVWNATFGKLNDWILGVVGYTQASKKCFGFNVDEQIDNMNGSFKKIGQSFSKDFGRLDFSKIKI